MTLPDRAHAWRSPLRLTLLVALSVFAAETLALLAVHVARPSAPLWIGILLDAAVLVVLMSPALFFLVFRPLTSRLEALARTEAQLRSAKEALAERARASDEALAAVFTASPVPLVVLTPEGDVSLWNPAAQAVFGWSADEVVGKPYPAVPPGREAEFRELLARAARGEHLPGIEVRRRRKDGALLDLSVWTAPLHDSSGTVTGILAVVVDVTARKHAEERLRLQGAALEATANAVMITDREGGIVWVNDAFSRLTGWSLDGCRGRTPRILKSGHHDRAFYEELWRTILGGQVWQHEMINVRKDGALYLEEQTITPVTDERGEITHFVAVKIDIGERKRVEAALRESEERHRVLAESASDAILIVDVVDQKPRISFVNRAAERIFGYSQAELLEAELTMLMPADLRQKHLVGLGRYMETGEKHISWIGFESRALHKSGREIPVEMSYGELRRDGRHGSFVGIVRDITERKLLEGQLRQAQKMEAIGQLAGGVAHDFNNLLSVIGGYSVMVLHGLPADHPQRKRVEEIRKAGERAAGLTRQLLTFGRKQAIAPVVLDLSQVVSGLEGMLRRLIPEHIEIVTRFDSGAAKVKADPGHMEQVILNLAVNARDAMPDGGRLIIETSPAELDEAYCRSHAPARPGRYVMLAVSDSGTGMDAETQARIFEPFFTTKEVGQGTGLGLATVYGIVKQNEGYIWVYSELGKGTTFKAYLPRVDDAVARDEERAPLAEAKTGSETVLLAEDDEAVRELNREILEDLGYHVLEGRDPASALEASARHEGVIHLLLTDMVMPGMTGRQLADRVRSSRPGIRVLFVSGYTNDVVVRSGDLDEGMAFLQKPFTPDSLGRKIREVLDAGGA